MAMAEACLNELNSTKTQLQMISAMAVGNTLNLGMVNSSALALASMLPQMMIKTAKLYNERVTEIDQAKDEDEAIKKGLRSKEKPKQISRKM
jgi:hypothetical protein